MRPFLIASAGLLCAMPLGRASVAPTNGDYFVSYTDIELTKDSAGNVAKVGRTYNSVAQFRGMFGYGWGSDFDTYLIPSVDGSLVVQESGAGAKTRFGGADLSQIELESLVQGIVDAKSSKMSGDRLFDKDAYRSRLMKDPDFRDDEARQLDKTRELPVGMVLYSSAWGRQSVTRTPSGYVRDTGRGVREFYERKSWAYDHGVSVANMRRISGVYRITRIENDVFKKTTVFSYDSASGYLLKIDFSHGSFFALEYDSLGLVTKATSNLGTSSTYRYCRSVQYDAKQRCQQADLISETDTSGNTYEYAYDNIHNIIEQGKSGGRKETIEYWDGPVANQRVKKTVSEDGQVEEYDYWTDPTDPDHHYRTTVLTTFSSGNSLRGTYEYWMKQGKGGSSYYLQRRVLRIGKDETETIYNECCGNPIRVTEDGKVTEIDYYPETGLIKEKRTADTILDWEYNAAFGRITKLTSKDRRSGQTTQEFSYQYNNQGMLASAASAAGARVNLTYDSQGRIATVEDQAKNKLLFDYDNNEKPTRIALQGGGAIIVSYDAAGNIDKVETEDTASPDSHGLAIKIAGMFQSLMQLIEPAGTEP